MPLKLKLFLLAIFAICLCNNTYSSTLIGSEAHYAESMKSENRRLIAFNFLKEGNFSKVEQLFNEDNIFLTKLNGYKTTYAEWLWEVITWHEDFKRYLGQSSGVKETEKYIALYEAAIKLCNKDDPFYYELHKSLIQLLEDKYRTHYKVGESELELEVYDEIINRYKNIKNEDLDFYVNKAMVNKSALLKYLGKPYYDLAVKSKFFETSDRKSVDEKLDMFNTGRKKR